MIRRSVTAAIGLGLAVATFTYPGAGEEALPVTAVTIEKSIPFEVTYSHLNNYDLGVYFGLGSVWILVHPNLLRIDPQSYAVTAIELKGVAGPIRVPAFGERAVWIADTGSNTVFKVDPATNRVEQRFKAPMISASSAVLGIGDGSLWMVTAENAERTLTRFDPTNGAVQAKIDLPTDSAGGVVFDFGSAWVVGTRNDEVYRIDPKSNAIVATIQTCRQPNFPTSGEGSIWVHCRGDGVVNRINGQTGEITATIETGSIGWAEMSIGGGYVWLSTFPTVLTQIDPRQNRVIRTFKGSDLHILNKVSYGAESLWMLRAAPTGEIYRIKPPG